MDAQRLGQLEDFAVDHAPGGFIMAQTEDRPFSVNGFLDNVQQIENEQNHEDQAEAAPGACGSTVGISAAAAEKNEQNDDKNNK
jgi:hypothetical protein